MDQLVGFFRELETGFTSFHAILSDSRALPRYVRIFDQGVFRSELNSLIACSPSSMVSALMLVDIALTVGFGNNTEVAIHQFMAQVLQHSPCSSLLLLFHSHKSREFSCNAKRAFSYALALSLSKILLACISKLAYY